MPLATDTMLADVIVPKQGNREGAHFYASRVTTEKNVFGFPVWQLFWREREL